MDKRQKNADSVAANANKDNTEFLNRSGSNQNADYVVVNANTDNTEFVNHALILWTEMRQQWVGKQHRNKAIQQAKPLLRSNTSYYERLLESKIPFPGSIPLREMIEFLRNTINEQRCLGGCAKLTLIIAMNKLWKKLKSQVRSMNEPSFSDNNSTVQSNRISGSNQNADSVAVNANTDNTEFVNHGFILWTEMREQWIGNRPRNKARQLADPVLRSNTSYECLLETESPFSRRIPLPEMIEFLGNVWKEEEIIVIC